MATATQTAPNGQAMLRYDPSKPASQARDLREMFVPKIADMERCYPAPQKSAAARLAQAVVTEWMKNPSLQKCSGISLLSCAVQASQLNLEIGGPMGQSYIVPYRDQATFQVGYRGLVALAHRSRRVASICAVTVRSGDKFKVIQGTNRSIEHDPCDPPGKEITHLYAVVQFRGGGMDFEVMTKTQCEEHRQRFSKDNRPGSCWAQHWEQMALKTVLRRLLKRCPIGVDLGPEEVPDEPTIIDAADLPPDHQELRQIEADEVEVIPDAEVTHPTTQSVPDERLTTIAEIDRLAVRSHGSWEAVKSSGLTAAIGFKGTRTRDLTLPQATALRVLLQAAIDTKQPPDDRTKMLEEIDRLSGVIEAREEMPDGSIEMDLCGGFEGKNTFAELTPAELAKAHSILKARASE